MTQQSISILKDCELWCDFDSQYVDEQRGIVRDRSGHGRHPVAEGGPTFGANGPDSFEAASLDGADDGFVSTDDFAFISSDSEFTYNCLIKQTKTGVGVQNIGALNGAADADIRFQKKRNELKFSYRNDNDGFDSPVTLSTNNTANEFQLASFRVKNGEIVVNSNGTKSSLSISLPSNFTRSDKEEFDTGGSAGSTDAFGGSIVFSILHSRFLSDAEIDYLNRLTAPRRSNV
jgi:hypothetical protein